MSGKRSHDDKKGGNSGKLRAHRAELRRAADERAAARKGRTNREQLALLDERPGESRRERARLEEAK